VAIYVEPTQLDIDAAQMGFLICEIAVTGRSAYFGVPELGVDALKASHAILSALFAHSAMLEARFPHPLVGRPFVLVTALSGGGYIAVSGECRISLILKLTPGESLDEAVRGLEQAVRGAPVDPAIAIAFEYPAGRDHRFGGCRPRHRRACPSCVCSPNPSRLFDWTAASSKARLNGPKRHS
jgi:acetylornithine deacetylase